MLVLSRWWRGTCAEEAFVTRSLAAALSRSFDVRVVVPGPSGPEEPDGLFDLVPAGTAPASGAWPTTVSPEGPTPRAVVVEDGDEGACRLAAHLAPSAPVFSLTSSATAAGDTVPVVPEELRWYVPINPLAAQRPHVGFGFTDYLLVLSDRGSDGHRDRPTSGAAWLAARFPRRHVVVVEDATASAFRSRSLRGEVHVDTRTDLQRLLAHARAVVDLRPGPLLARECVESLRFGIPVVVPEGTVGARLTARCGGLRYRDVAELAACVQALEDGARRDELAALARAGAEDRHSRPEAFVETLGELVRSHLAPAPRRTR